MADVLITAVALIVLLGTLIMAHEWGHFVTAKLLKVKVSEFAFGLPFGPRVLRFFKRGDTEYTMYAVPMGGFVRLAGMEPGEENVADGFLTKPWYQRFLVFFSGPAMSFLLAYFIFCMMGFTLGLPITGDVMNKVDVVVPNSIAEQVGFKSGDIITGINGVKITSGKKMLEIVHASPGKSLVISVNRDGRPMTMKATPRATKMEDGKMVGLVGFVPAQRLERIGFRESVRFGNAATITFVKTTFHVLFSREVKDNVGGPIAIADATLSSVKRGPYGYMQLMGVLSLSLAIVNMIPIPVVDGGQMLLILIEAIRRRRFSPRTMEMSQRIGWTMIAVLFTVIMYMDLTKLAANKYFR